MQKRLISFFFTLSLTASALAGPLLTEEYPLWVRDAVLVLREQGLVSSGCLPHQAVQRAEMMPVLERWLLHQEHAEKGFVERQDLESTRALLRALQQELEQLQQRTGELETKTP